MTAEGAIEFEALEAQAASLMSLFVGAGYERVAPSFIQPASLFLDRIGETLRARTYVFTDPNGEELCLRPDLTIPVCRVFLERPSTNSVSKFCYNGPAFRIQEGKPDPLRPREFRQAGVEYFGERSQDADLEVLALTIEAVRNGGVRSFTVKMGDIGIFWSLLHSLQIPARWRERLQRAFWRPQAFARELATLSTPKAARPPVRLAAAALTEAGLLNDLEQRGVTFVGVRRPSEVIARLKDKAADANEPSLPRETVRLLEDYLRVGGDMTAALDRIDRLFDEAGLDLQDAVGRARSLLLKLRAIAGDLPIAFAADFGRHFEYYTGMVFQLETEGAGITGQIAGGGRYDGLIRALSGGSHDVPAVGAAVHTERLLAAARR